jgi:hypothetical protein
MAKSLLSKQQGLNALRLARSHPKNAAQLSELRADVTQRASTLAVSSPEVQKALGGRRHRVLGGDLHVRDAGGAIPLPRHGELAIYDYDRNVLLSVIVDLQTSAVVKVDELPGRQPPPSAEEEKEAGELALKDSKVAKVLAGKRVTATAWPAREAFLEGNSAHGRRVVEVFFWTTGPKPQRVGERVLVDLSSRNVVSATR